MALPASASSAARTSDSWLGSPSEPHPNGLAYDRRRRRLYVFNLGEPPGENCTASVIDLGSMQVAAELSLPGRPRWALYDESRDRVYANIRDPAQIAVIDAGVSEIERGVRGAERGAARTRAPRLSSLLRRRRRRAHRPRCDHRRGGREPAAAGRARRRDARRRACSVSTSRSASRASSAPSTPSGSSTSRRSRRRPGRTLPAGIPMVAASMSSVPAAAVPWCSRNAPERRRTPASSPAKERAPWPTGSAPCSSALRSPAAACPPRRSALCSPPCWPGPRSSRSCLPATATASVAAGLYRLLFVAMALAGTVFALTGWLPALIAAAFTGTISTDVIESGPFTSLEQAMLPHVADEQDPTRLFGTYNTVATLAGSLGALIALLGSSPHWLLAYPLAAAAGLLVTARLSPAVELGHELDAEPLPPLASFPRDRCTTLGAVRARQLRRRLRASDVHRLPLRPQVRRLAANARGRLLHHRPPPGTLVSGRCLARWRIGLLRTMVFTHLPSNVLLAAIAFAPNLRAAIALLLARSLLSQADVPTRQAYVAAVVDPSERTAAAAYTNTARYLTRPLAPLLAGAALRGRARPAIPASQACSRASTTSASTRSSGGSRSAQGGSSAVPT